MLIKAEDSRLIFYKTSRSVPVLSREIFSTFLKHGIISVGHRDGADVKPDLILTVYTACCVCVSIHPFSVALSLTGKQPRFVIRIFPFLHSSAVN